MIRQSTHALTSMLVMGIGKALFVLLTANFYGPEGQGIVTLGISVMVGLSLLLGLGSDISNSYLVGTDAARLRRLRDNSTLITLGSLLLAFGILQLAFQVFGDTIFGDFPHNGRTALVLLVALQIYHQQIQGLVVGVGGFHHLSMGNLLQHLVLVVGVTVLYAAGEPVVAVLYLWAASLVVKIVYLLLRLPSPTTECRESRLALFRSQFALGSQMMLGSLANLLNFRLDAYFIAYFLPATHLGWYAVAATIAEGMLYLPKALGQVVLSRVSQARGEVSDVRRQVRDIFVTTSYATLLLVLLVQLVLGPAVSVLFGKDFGASLAPARVLLVASVVYGIGLIAMNLIYGLGRPTRNTAAGMLAVGVNAAGNVIAIPQWGILGAAYVSLLSYSAYCVLNIYNVGECVSEPRPFRYLLVADRDYFARLVATITEIWTSLRHGGTRSLFDGQRGAEEGPRQRLPDGQNHCDDEHDDKPGGERAAVEQDDDPAGNDRDDAPAS